MSNESEGGMLQFCKAFIQPNWFHAQTYIGTISFSLRAMVSNLMNTAEAYHSLETLTAS